MSYSLHTYRSKTTGAQRYSNAKTTVIELTNSQLKEVERNFNHSETNNQAIKKLQYAISIGINKHLIGIHDCYNGIGNLPEWINNSFENNLMSLSFTAILFECSSSILLYEDIQTDRYIAVVQYCNGDMEYEEFSYTECEDLVDKLLDQPHFNQDLLQLLCLKSLTCTTQTLINLYEKVKKLTIYKSKILDVRPLNTIELEMRRRCIKIQDLALKIDSVTDQEHFTNYPEKIKFFGIRILKSIMSVWHNDFHPKVSV